MPDTGSETRAAARSVALAAALAAALVASGCASLGSPDAVSARVARLRGATYEPEGSWQVGPHALGLVRAFAGRAGMAGDAGRRGGDAPGTALAGIHEIRGGTYRRTSDALAAPRPLKVEDFRGYETVAARQSRAGDGVLLLSRGSNRKVKELLLIVDGGETLSVVQVTGDLSGLLDRASRLAFDQAERPDLATEFAGEIPPARQLPPD